MNDGGVCGTAPATLGLLMILRMRGEGGLRRLIRLSTRMEVRGEEVVEDKGEDKDEGEDEGSG